MTRGKQGKLPPRSRCREKAGRACAAGRHFRDTVKATAELSYVSLGLGMVLGVLLGPIPIPIPGVGTVTRSADRGSYRRQAAPNRSVALGDAASREHLLRNFGLAMFLAAV